MNGVLIKDSSKRSARNVITVVLVLGIVACVFPVNLAAFAFSNAQSASIVIGKSSFTDSSTFANPPTAATERYPKGIAFDSSGNLWITDSTNNRVLEYLKGSGFTNGQSASLILGKSSFTDNSTGANPPTAASLRNPAGIAFDSSGNLWVADTSNSRVLEYLKGSGFTNGQSASLILGKSSFTDNSTGANPPTVSSESFPLGIAFDSSGNLWVADSNNNRVLEYLKGPGFTSGQSASLVIGKSNFTDNAIVNPPNIASERFVQGIAFDSSGNLWVGDTGNNRVLEYLKGSGFTSGQSASLILGKSSFTDNSTAANPPTAASEHFPQGLTFDSSGNLWVGDSFNNRVLEYLKGSGFTNGQSASLVIGQPGFTTRTAVVSQTGLSTIEPAFNGPKFDSSGNLWVADESAHRVLEYLASSVSVSVPEFPFGIPVVIVTMSAFYFMMRKKFSLKI